MAEVVLWISDKVIFTSDNPRTEFWNNCRRHGKGVDPRPKKTISIVDRRQAIKSVLYDGKMKTI
jgi:UDP-N-acetylmuramyl tripeptide synthase